MADRKILAFYSPYPQAGKSTAAAIIADSVYSFADPIKDIINNLCFLYGNDIINAPELGLNTRDLYIALGQGLKKVNPDIWVRIMTRTIKNLTREVKVLAIDDLRFPNEYLMLSDKGAKTVRITNPGREIIKSETEGLLENCEFDYEIINDKSSLETYRDQLNEMMNNLWP